MVSSKDVAKRAGVSQVSVSNVINGRKGVSEETRRKILKAIETLNYFPNESARRLRQKKLPGATGNIGCIIFCEQYNKYSHPTHTKVLEGIDKEIIDQAYHLYFTYTTDQLSSNVYLLGKIGPETIDGLIFVGGLSEKEEALLVKVEEKISNIVSVASRMPLSMKKVDTYQYDLKQAGYDAVQYLAGLGHRRIGFVGNHPIKLKGYQAGVEAFGTDKDKNIVNYKETLPLTEGVVDSEKSGYMQMKEMLENTQKLPSALFVDSDRSAIGAMKALSEKGLNVPGDISVIGLDNIEESKRINPPLATIDTRSEEIGRQAVRRLIERIKNPEIEPITVRLTPKLVVRDSCRQAKQQQSSST